MPTIDDLKQKSTKKFKKSDYRPWNYMDEIDKESNENHLIVNQESISNREDIKKESFGSQLGINKESETLNSLLTTKVLKNSTESINNLISENSETTLDAIFRLTGHQKRIFNFIIDRCASRATLSTGAIKGETLSEITNTTLKMVKTSIQRLLAKGLITRERGKTGRGGFYIFTLTESVRNSALEYKRMLGFENQLVINSESYGNQLAIKKESFVDSIRSLPDDWASINISPLDHIGFNKNHLIDIHETGLSDSKMVQESILHFAYGLEFESNKYNQYDDVIKVLIGRLRKGKPWFEKNYRSPQEIAQVQYLEQKKAELERKKNIEEEIYKIAFDEWRQGLNQTEIDEIAPDLRKNGDLTPPLVKLSTYFKDHIWTNTKKNFHVD